MPEIEFNLTIRFDGLDAEKHEIDLFTFGESMQGIARIAGTVGHLISTHQYSRYFRSHDLKVLAQEPRANCFSIDIAFEFMKQHQILSGSFGTLIAILFPYLYLKMTKRDTEAQSLNTTLVQLLNESTGNNNILTHRLLDNIERMSLDLQPAMRQSVSPIGGTCKTITFISPIRRDTFNAQDKAILALTSLDAITEVQNFNVLITELDLERGSCKARMADDPDNRRVSAVISDPLLNQTNNPYSLAMAAGDFIPVKAKAVIEKGEIRKLFISDIGT